MKALKKDLCILTRRLSDELKRLKRTTNKGTNQKLAIFQVVPDSAHRAELARYHGHIKLDDIYIRSSANTEDCRMTYTITIGYHISEYITFPIVKQALKKRISRYNVFDWKIHFEKVQ